MARNSAGSLFRFLALGVVTISAGTAIGYYVFGGMHAAPPTADPAGIQEAPVPASPSDTPTPTPPKTRPARLNSDYTAPNAPRIHIVEDRTPSREDSPSRPHSARQSSDGTDSTDIPTPDVEASQQGNETADAAAPSGHSAAGSASSDATTPPVPAPRASANDTESSQTGAPSGTSTPDGSSATASPAAGTPSTDAEANQTGTPGGTAKAGGKTQYRVQAGSFASADNARDYVSSLHNRGVDASLHAEQQGDKTVYKVQVGAYRSRADANQAADGLRHNGVPVTVSPANP